MPDASISEIVGDAITTHHINLLRVAADLRTPVLRELERLAKGLADEIAATPETAGVIKRARTEALLKQTRAMIDEAYATIAANQGKDLAKIAGIEQTKIGKTYDAAIGVKVMTVGSTKQELEALVGNTMINGRFAREWWDKQAQDVKDRYAAAVRMGIYQGEGIDAIVRRVRGTAAMNYKDGVMTLAKAQAEALVRTSVLAVANEAKLDSFEKNPDIIKAVQWVSTLDSRTTEICIALDGKQWALPDYDPIGHTIPFPGPTAHWNCRSTQIAVTKSWAELSGPRAVKPPKADPAALEAIFRKNLARQGFTTDEIDRIVAEKKFTMDGEPAPRQSMTEFLQKQTKLFQDQLLGPAKAQLWREGKITLADLIDQTHRPLSVAELQTLVARNEATAGQKVFEGQHGLSMAERKLLEESAVSGANDKTVLAHIIDSTNGSRISFNGTTPSAKDFETAKKFEGATYLRNALGKGEVFGPQELGLIADLPKFQTARMVAPDGKVITLSLKPGQTFTRADAAAINTQLSVRTNRSPVVAFRQAIADNGKLKITETAPGAIQPPAKMFTRAADSTQLMRDAPAVAKAVYQKAAAAEPLVTEAMKLVARDNGGELAGLQFRLKTEESLARKIGADARDKGISVGDAAGQISDALRYTIVLPENSYTVGVKQTLHSLEELGVKVDRLKNFWDGQSYEGINVKLSTISGQSIELQFHTAKTLEVKEKLSHPIYELMRVTTDPALLKKYEADLLKVWENVPMPPGVRKLGDDWRELKLVDAAAEAKAAAEAAAKETRKVSASIREDAAKLFPELAPTQKAVDEAQAELEAARKAWRSVVAGAGDAAEQARQLVHEKSLGVNRALVYHRNNVERVNELIRQRVILPAEQRATIKAKADSKARAGTRGAAIDEGIGILGKILHKDATAVREFVFEATRKQRSHFSPTRKTVNLGPPATGRTALHELGHALEDLNPAILKQSIEFHAKRTAGEKAVKLSKLQPGFGYGPKEVGMRDKFSDVYMGKVYFHGNRQYATEILSMGLEQLWYNGAEFAKNDPEYFEFVVNALRIWAA